MSDENDLRARAVRVDATQDPGAPHHDTEAVARFTRGMVNGYTHQLRGQYEIELPPVTRDDVEAMEGLSSEQVEAAVRQNLPAALRTDDDVRAIVDRLRAGPAHVLADRVGEAARQRLEAAERALPRDARRASSFFWSVAQSSRQDVAVARLAALGMEPEAAR